MQDDQSQAPAMDPMNTPAAPTQDAPMEAPTTEVTPAEAPVEAPASEPTMPEADDQTGTPEPTTSETPA